MKLINKEYNIGFSSEYIQQESEKQTFNEATLETKESKKPQMEVEAERYGVNKPRRKTITVGIIHEQH